MPWWVFVALGVLITLCVVLMIAERRERKRIEREWLDRQ